MREKLIISAVVALAAVGAVRAAEYELKWDTGEVGGRTVWGNVAAGLWLGNEFDVSTLKALYVNRIKIMSSAYNASRWDGFRIALWGFKGETPDEIIWPTSGVPKFVKGYGTGRYTWCEFDVGWTLPAQVTTFVAAQEQFFFPPYCDSYVVDDAVPKERRTWYKNPVRAWIKYCPQDHTLMLRVIMEDDDAVTPTSLGRVKALYH